MSQVTGSLVGCRSLVVEDEYFIAEVMAAWLTPRGC